MVVVEVTSRSVDFTAGQRGSLRKAFYRCTLRTPSTECSQFAAEDGLWRAKISLFMISVYNR